MNAPFPFALPAATVLYAVFFVLTLVTHVLFMNYVLGGAAYLAGAGLQQLAGARPKKEGEAAFPNPMASDRLLAIVRDWMPAMLSGAITMAVAPLLFVQILYKTQFYTANLLLFHRWMSILPVLMVGFYTLYVLKSHWFDRPRGILGAVVAAVPLACFLFVAFSWTENHLLSLQGHEKWAAFYGQGSLFYFEAQLLPRLGVWVFGALPTWALFLAWQVWYRQQPEPTAAVALQQTREAQTLALWALVGFGAALLFSLLYFLVGGAALHGVVLSKAAFPYVLLAFIGVMLEITTWGMVWQTKALSRLWLIVGTVGLVLAMVGTAVVRECLRIAALGPATMEALWPLHKKAAEVGGMPVFLFFFVLNATLIAGCFIVIRKHLRPQTA